MQMRGVLEKTKTFGVAARCQKIHSGQEDQAD